MNKVKLKVPASYKFLNPIFSLTEKLVELFSSDEKALAIFPLAVQEIMANIIEHSYEEKGGEISILWEVSQDTIRVEFSFGGKRVEIPEEEFDLERKMKERKGRGLGLEIVRKIADELEYGYKGGRNWWRITRKFRN